MTSGRMMMSRVSTEAPSALRVLHVLRSLAMRRFLAGFHRLRDMLRTDLRFREFHEGRSSTLPDFYRRLYEKKLGNYASLLSPAERTPELGVPRHRIRKPSFRHGRVARMREVEGQSSSTRSGIGQHKAQADLTGTRLGLPKSANSRCDDDQAAGRSSMTGRCLRPPTLPTTSSSFSQ